MADAATSDPAGAGSSGGGSSAALESVTDVEIRDVWADNLDAEMVNVRRLAEKYRYISMDTEFPGIVARPLERMEASAFYYENVRINVDLMKIIQLGITFTDDKGRPLDGCCCFQFNFQFDLEQDMHAPVSIDLLRRSGIDFDQHRKRGISLARFGELLMSSGLVLTEDVTWVSFHGGFDFGYLLKVLTCLPLPKTSARFFETLRLYFPSFVDIKHITDRLGQDDAPVRGLDKIGLSKLGTILHLPRIGQMHTAGSDSLLTAFAYFKLKELHFTEETSRDILGPRFHGVLHGLNDRTR